MAMLVPASALFLAGAEAAAAAKVEEEDQEEKKERLVAFFRKNITNKYNIYFCGFNQ